MRLCGVQRSRRVRAGFTLIEALIVVAVLAVLVAMVVPMFTPDDRQRLNAAAMILAADIEYAQVVTIARPQDPLVVRFDGDRVRFWIARAASPNSPIQRPDTNEPYETVFGIGRAATADGVRFALHDLAGGTMEFDSHGGLMDFTSTPRIVLTADGKAYPRVTLTIAPTTGTISVEYEPQP